MSARRALITGITGQDGSYLADFLLQLGYEVHGLVRRPLGENFERIEHIRDQLRLHRGDLLDQLSLEDALARVQPAEIYNLAAISDVGVSWLAPELSAQVTGLGVTRLLEAMRRTCPDARLVQACSSEAFGQAAEVPQTERTPLRPCSPHGAAKAHAHFMVQTYRQAHGLFAANAILFNHESPRRGREFVTGKITWHAAAIKLGLETRLQLGNRDAERDWGFALDYVRALWLMLQQDVAEDFVIATGTAHSVREWLQVAFDHAGLAIDEHVETNPALFRPVEVEHLVGDASKASRILGWEPEVGFRELVHMMVDADQALLRRELNLGGGVRR